MNSYDMQYKKILHRILNEGVDSDDRTGVGVRKVFDANINVDLDTGTDGVYTLPALTLRRTAVKSSFYEMIWMLSGNTDASWLQDRGIKIWDGNSSREFLDSVGLNHIKEGNIGKGYGHQFRNSDGVDQLARVVYDLTYNPSSRRHVINLWNVSDLSEMALPPCHMMYQFVVTGEHLNLKFTQRSSDFVLAASMNCVFASFFLALMAKMTGFKVGKVAHSMVDVHAYQNHLEAAQVIMDRDPMPSPTFTLDSPLMSFGDAKGEPCFHDMGVEEYLTFVLSSLDWEDVTINYQHHPALPKEMLPMAV